MNCLNRALKNITRKKAKTILLLLTFFLIGNLVIIGIGISTAASQAKILTRKSMRAAIEYRIDYEYIDEIRNSMSESELEEFMNSDKWEKLTRITSQEYLAFLNDERVATLNCSSYYQTILDIDPLPLNNEYEQSNSNEYTSVYEVNGELIEETRKDPNFKLVTNRVPNMIELYEGTWTITEGKFYTQEEIDNAAPVCVINDRVAELNGLSIGDTIHLTLTDTISYLNAMGVDTSQLTDTFELTIVGLYSTVETIDQGNPNFDWMQTSESPFNKVLMPITTYSEFDLPLTIANWEYNKQLYPEYADIYSEENRPTRESVEHVNSIIFLLKDPLDVESFIEDYQMDLDYEGRLFSSDNGTFKKMARPLDSIELYAKVILAIVILNAIIIITLVTALTMKTREYEIGVLVSLGTSKFKVVAQMFTELLIIALIGFTLSVISGSMIASKAGEALLAYQVDVDDEYASDFESDIIYYGMDNYFTEVEQKDLIANYEVTISPIIIGEIYVAGIGIVLLSILVPSMMIMRFNPKKILTSSL